MTALERGLPFNASMQTTAEPAPLPILVELAPAGIIDPKCKSAQKAERKGTIDQWPNVMVIWRPPPGVHRGPTNEGLNKFCVAKGACPFRPAKPVAVAAAQKEPPKPVAAEKPVPEKPAAGKPAVEKPAAARPDDVIQAVNAWAKAWSAKDVEAYLAFYAKDFQTPGGEPRAEWEKTRRQRLTAPKTISVSVESPKVTLSGENQASVTFRQSYRSDVLKATGHKTLVMVRSEGRWMIQQEKVAN